MREDLDLNTVNIHCPSCGYKFLHKKNNSGEIKGGLGGVATDLRLSSVVAPALGLLKEGSRNPFRSATGLGLTGEALSTASIVEAFAVGSNSPGAARSADTSAESSLATVETSWTDSDSAPSLDERFSLTSKCPSMRGGKSAASS